MTKIEAHEVVRSPEAPEDANIVKGRLFDDENPDGNVRVATCAGATVAVATITPPIDNSATIGAPPPVFVTVIA
tara:strand:- start:310 stop:531 length:222 start_codon:yes stop_codon:yes gene_type:complete